MSALAITGIKLTRVPKRFMISMSRGFNLNCNDEIQPPEYDETVNLRMTGWPNEEKTCVNPEINFTLPLGLLFLSHVQLMLVVNKVDDGSPRVPIVDIIAKARRVDNSKLHLEGLLLQLRLDDLDLHDEIRESWEPHEML